VGATRYRIFLPVTPAGFGPTGANLLVQRTNLLSPSVALLPVFKVSQITATTSKMTESPRSVNRLFFEKIFPQDILPELQYMRLSEKSQQFPEMET
jgi:hypothetical protein